MPPAAEGDGEGVGDVGGLGWRFQMPDLLDRALHLGFAGVTVTDDGLLDAVGGELFDADVAPLGGEENDAAGVAHEDGGSGMFVMGVQLFDGADVGFEFLHQLIEFGFQFDQALGEGGFGVEADDAAVDEFGRESPKSTTP